MLSLDDYQRYGRQLILDQFGLPGQLKLQAASVAVVGAGGLGCPAIQYLAAAGIGHIGIIDHDIVELSNLQRQILHTQDRIGTPKAISAATAVAQINPKVKTTAITEGLTAQNASNLLQSYDIILDCTDNAPTRYLLSDTAVALGKPLVSGAAQKYEGQLSVYNLGPDGPCYRCLFPRPPAPELTGSCAEVGVLGVVTGIIGNLQALETIKIITGLHEGKPSLLIFSALSMPPFRSIKLRSRRPTCSACGTEGEKLGSISNTDYVAFCGGARPDWETQGLVVRDPQRRIRAADLHEQLQSGAPLRIIDVRPPVEFGICHLPGSINIPLTELVADPTKATETVPADDTAIYCVCRLGNDSQLAVDALTNAGRRGVVRDLIGGLRAWSKEVDNEFPIY
ncbi:hypothetical protein K474DRAFT_1660503 [Panus rudis PR-1116 ss-1]|nr:hypothetical protein K474DRAFT_1660503 [Panus rudis PR-1116 ss-1]